MRLTSFHSLGSNRQTPRLWLESARLDRLGFSPGCRVAVTPIRSATGPGITLTVGDDRAAGVSVVERRTAGYVRPVIDLNSRRHLGHFSGFRELKITGTYGHMLVTPSVRAFSIRDGLASRSVYRMVDIFCGGGTASDAFANSRFRVVAGVEVSPLFADEYSRKHPDAEIILGDFRFIHPSELPEFDGLFVGLPCTCHSTQARTKKGLRGAPELGDTGDLYIPVLGLVATRMPAFLVLENVPSFATSLAGRTVLAHLMRLGYHVSSAIIDPLNDYGEPSSRRRWVCVATLHRRFSIPNPHTPFRGTINRFLDKPNAVLDRQDASRIARTIVGLRAHSDRHAAKGNGFRLTVLDRRAKKLPTILKSYHKINNSGAFLSTPYGPRMLRPSEVCRIHGHTFISDDATSVYQMSGQGVQTRVFRTIADALAEFLP